MSFASCYNDTKSFSSLDLLYAVYRARGRGGMNLGPGGISANFNTDNSTYQINANNTRNHNMGGNGRKGAMNMNGGRRMGVNRMTVANSKTGHSVHMRGLPFESTAADVIRFFAPLQPVDIRLLYESNTGRPKGECDVDFTTHHDAEEAMKKDKQNMGHRYIELFLKSTIHGNGKWNNNNNIIGKSSPPLLLSHNNNNRSSIIQQPNLNNIYAGGFNITKQQQTTNQNRFNTNSLPPIGCNFNNNTPSSLGFVRKPLPPPSAVDPFGANRVTRDDLNFKDTSRGLDLLSRTIHNGSQTIQNGCKSNGVQSFYSNAII